VRVSPSTIFPEFANTLIGSVNQLMRLEDRGFFAVGTLDAKTTVGEFRLRLEIIILKPARLGDFGVRKFLIAKWTSQNPTRHTENSEGGHPSTKRRRPAVRSRARPGTFTVKGGGLKRQSAKHPKVWLKWQRRRQSAPRRGLGRLYHRLYHLILS
jgi:hypothetical protein